MGALFFGCDNHHVSPWGPGGPPPLSLYAATPDLEAQLDVVDRETAESGVQKTFERRRELPAGGGTVVLRAYEGSDSLGRRTHAVRVVTARGVVMAVGPLRAEDVVRRKATELVPSLASEVLSDLNGDRTPDVVLRGEDRHIEIWSLAPSTAVRVEVELEVPATGLEEIDEDGGGPEVVGRVPLAASDPLSPELTDIAAFDGEGYDNRSPVALRYHARRVEERIAMVAAASSDEARIRAALERAWHEILAGEPREEALERLDAVKVPPSWEEAFADHRRRIARIGQ